LRSAVRRRSAQDTNRDAVIRHGDLELGPVKYRLLKRGNSIHLTPKEFEVLHYLMMRAGEPIPHSHLLKLYGARNMATSSSACAHLFANCARK
jgi:two-component system, OmpR family, KDP operon response regulator KdpE